MYGCISMDVNCIRDVCHTCENVFTDKGESQCENCKYSQVCDRCHKNTPKNMIVHMSEVNGYEPVYCRPCYDILNTKSFKCDKCKTTYASQLKHLSPIGSDEGLHICYKCEPSYIEMRDPSICAVCDTLVNAENIGDDLICQVCVDKGCKFCKQIEYSGGKYADLGYRNECRDCEVEINRAIDAALLSPDDLEAAENTHYCIGCETTLATSYGFCEVCFHHVVRGVCCSCKQNDELPLNARGHCTDCEDAEADFYQSQRLCKECDINEALQGSIHCYNCDPDFKNDGSSNLCAECGKQPRMYGAQCCKDCHEIYYY